MIATIEFMYASGPLIGACGKILADASAPEDPTPAAPTVVRCVDRDGRDLATPITVRPDQPLALEALRLVIRDREHGTCSPDRFGRATFAALQNLDERTSLTLRDRAIQKRLQLLDHLAVVGYDHDGTIAW